MRLTGIILILLGIGLLFYQEVVFFFQDSPADQAPVSASTNPEESIYIPSATGVIGIVCGSILLTASLARPDKYKATQ